MLKLSVVVPAYNEAPTIEKLLGKVLAVSFPVPVEIVVIDDHSTDLTHSLCEKVMTLNPGREIKLLRNEVNRGKGLSIQRGLEIASGDVVVVQDADFEYDPAEIPTLLEPILEGKVSVVYGSRFLNRSRPDGMALPNFIANKFLTWLTNILYGASLTDMETCYKLIKTDVLRSITLKADRFDFEPEVTTKILQKKLPIQELPISYHGRGAGEGKKIKARDFFIAIRVLLRNLFVRP